MTARRLHRALAGVLALFIAAHLGNHLALLWGPEAHLAVQAALRLVYRAPLVEPLLLAAVAVQVGLGLCLLWRRGWPRAWPQRVQVLAGAILALFLAQHVGAVLTTRAFRAEVDTTVYWAASVVSRPDFAAYFAPYYVFGVAALFAHLAALLWWRRKGLAWGVAGAGLALALVIVAGLMGGFGPVDLPPAYQAYLDDFWI